jgi:hypothetical protein
MTGYNKINGDYAGGNTVLIQDVLKGAWGLCQPVTSPRVASVNSPGWLSIWLRMLSQIW